MTSKINFSRIFMPMMFFLIILYIGTGCNPQGKGFALPEGNLETGKATFTKLKCNGCHSISNIQWTGNADSLHVSLGGTVRMMKSYGELVASVINPSHKISANYYVENVIRTNEDGSSKMTNYNAVMTVQELVDIVTFLQSEYKIERPGHNYYPMY